MGAIFISYRRGDSEGQARALAIELGELVGKDQVFMDVDSIALGRDFRQVLQERLGNCDMLLALIGPNWLEARDAAGNRRLDSPTDFVRQEVASALRRNIPVTPVLLQGATMPPIDRLPSDLQDLAFRNGFELSHSRWESDYRELIKRLGLAVTRTTVMYTGAPSQTAPPAAAPAASPFTKLPALPTASHPIPPAPAAHKTDASPTPPTAPTTPARRSRSLMISLIAAAAILLLIAVAVWVRHSNHQAAGPSQPAQTGPAPANQEAAAAQFAGNHHLTSKLVEAANKCLESGDGNGPIQVNPCGDYSGQMWTFEPASGAYYHLKSVYTAPSNKCLDSGDGSGPATMNPCDNSSGQLWKMTPATQFGYYRLQSMGTEPQNGCFESSSGSSPSKVNPCGNAAGQLWRILDN